MGGTAGLETQPIINPKDLPPRQQADLRYLVWEGSLNTVFAALVGGAFLVGFALSLGASDAQIGLIAALPPFLNLVQIAGSYLIQRIGSAKAVCLAASAGFRGVWLLILASPWLFFRGDTPAWSVALLLVSLGLASLFGSLSGISWMSWITPLVPESMRGRFFGHRSMTASAAGMVAGLAAGYFVDVWQVRFPGTWGEIQGFALLFAVGLAFGILGWLMLSRVSEQPVEKEPAGAFLSELKQPFRHAGFRRWMMFAITWGFSVGLAAPFFSIYMIRTLSVPFSVIALFGVTSGFFNTLGMRLWGSLIDDIGSKPLLLFCSIGGALLPLLWLFAVPGSYQILWLVNLLSGLAWSGIGLSTSNLLMSTAPPKNSSTYFAVFAAVTGLASAAAPLVGGAVAGMLAPLELTVGPLTLGHLQAMFVLTAVLRLASLALLRPVPAAKDMPVQELLLKLESLSRFQLARGSQQMASIGMHSWESGHELLANGTIAVEKRTARLIDEGILVAKKVKTKADRVDSTVELGVSKWEQFLNRAIDAVIRLFKRS